jgi:hypothetical protein
MEIDSNEADEEDSAPFGSDYICNYDDGVMATTGPDAGIAALRGTICAMDDK